MACDKDVLGASAIIRDGVRLSEKIGLPLRMKEGVWLIHERDAIAAPEELGDCKRIDGLKLAITESPR
ncbi:hypothetical protein AF71_00058140 [Rhizobium sp. 57MFTsu3.2]|nr:hypothetical protein [Rhizobium sp. 57MFTsu3.2]